MRRPLRDIGQRVSEFSQHPRQSLGEQLLQLDDNAQRLGRDVYTELGAYADQYVPGNFGRNLREFGEDLHRDRRDYFKAEAPDIATLRLLSSRGLQAVGLTSAGVNLLNLINHMQSGQDNRYPY